MTRSGDTKRPRCVKAEFDPGLRATAHGGAALLERTLRSLKIRRHLAKHLPERSKGALHAARSVALALVEGLLLGGRGLLAAEALRGDALLAEILGAAGAPSPATVYRALCDLAGIEAGRAFADWYEPSGPRLARLDISGAQRRLPAARRRVPEAPEEATAERLGAMAALLGAVAVTCAGALPTAVARTAGFVTVFGDGTDLEVEGNCFDAAHTGRGGKRLVRWLTLMAGPLVAGQRLMAGNLDEGRQMPALLEETKAAVRALAGRKAPVLALLDAAYFERPVVEWLASARWHFIVCANQQREALARLAGEQPAAIWSATGPDAARGWTASEVGCFTYGAANWRRQVTIVARRWRQEGELPAMAWHHSFVGTDLEEKDLPEDLVAKHGYAQAIWMLYGTKQARENHYKTALEDLGLHHPPSGRLGVSQAFYALASVAHNVAMVLRYRVAPRQDHAIALWRLRERYFRIAGTLVRHGRTLLVRLSGALDAWRQTLWQAAYAEAGRF